MTGPRARATTDSLGRRAWRRLLSGRLDPADRPARRAGVDPVPSVLVTPRLWSALA